MKRGILKSIHNTRISMASFAQQHNLSKNFLRFFPSPKLLTMPSVGIDISDSAIKFLELVDTDYGKGLGKYGERTIPEGAVVGGVIQNGDTLTKVLQALQKEQDLRFIRASLPEEKAYLFKTWVPTSAKDIQIRNAIEFKLEENVPISPDEAVFDYDIPAGEMSDSDEMEVSVAVYSRKTVEQYTEVFQKANLIPLSFEVESQAIARSVIRKGDEGTYMIIDFGKMRTGLGIVSRGLLSFTSTLDVVGDTLTEAIAKQFSVSKEEAERIKNESDFIKNKENSELFLTMMKTISELKDEIVRHYRYWNTRVDGRGQKSPSIDQIILCGGSANVVGLSEYLSGSVRVKAKRANVWLNALSFEEVIPNIDYSHSLGYATAIGLALRKSI